MCAKPYLRDRNSPGTLLFGVATCRVLNQQLDNVLLQLSRRASNLFEVRVHKFPVLRVR